MIYVLRSRLTRGALVFAGASILAAALLAGLASGVFKVAEKAVGPRPGAQVEGQLAPPGLLTEAGLTDRSPIVVDGVVLEKKELPINEDPFLPAQNQPDEQALVDSKAKQLKLKVSVWVNVKGTTARQIWIQTAAEHGDGYSAGGDGAATNPGIITNASLTLVGQTYRFWLHPNTWFGNEHYFWNAGKHVVFGTP